MLFSDKIIYDYARNNFLVIKTLLVRAVTAVGFMVERLGCFGLLLCLVIGFVIRCLGANLGDRLALNFTIN